MRSILARTLILIAVVVALSVTLTSHGTADADTVVTINGRAVYENADGDPFGIDGAKVMICDDDGLFLPAQCVDTTTDSNGNFSAQLDGSAWDEDDDELEVYIDVIADAPGINVVPDGLFGGNYCFRSPTLIVTDGQNADFGELRPLQSRSCDISNSLHTDERENSAFYVFSNLRRGWQFVSGVTSSVNGASVPKMTAKLVSPDDSEDGDVSFYKDGNLTLQPSTWQIGNVRGVQTQYHEFGHHLLNSFAESPSPDYNNGNCDSSDTFLIWEIPDPGHCQWLAEDGVVAWTEGFPTFLALVIDSTANGSTRLTDRIGVQEYDGVNYWTKGLETPAMRNAAADGTEIFKLTNDSGVFEDHPDNNIEQVEGFTSAALWDLYDSAVDDHDKDDARDTAAMSFLDIWTVVSDYDPDPTDTDHNHPLTIAEFYDGIRDIFPNELTQARLAGPFIENHFDVPAAALGVDSTGTFQDWNSNDKFGRGDTLTAHYSVCRPAGSQVSWGGEGQISIILLHPTTGSRLFEAPPLTLPDVGPGGCAEGIYEFVVPADMELFGPRFISGSMTDNHAVFDAIVCADPNRLLAEENESDNCRDPHTLRLQNKPPVLVTNQPSGGFVVDEGSDLIIDFSGSFDPDPIPGQGLEYKVASAGTDFDTGIGFVSTPMITFSPADTAELADGTEPGTLHAVQLRIRDDGDPQFSSEAINFGAVTVRNVAPTTFFTNVPAGGQFLALEGTPVTITGQFFDPGADTWEVSVFLEGEAGPTPVPITDVDFVTSIIPNGYYGFWEVDKSFANQTGSKGAEVNACVVDDDGGEGCAPIGQMQVVVYNVAPTVILPVAVEANEVGEATVEGSFTDPGVDDPWTGTANIDAMGAAPITLNADMTFSVPLAFTEVGFHPVEICITDDRATSCETVEVEVANLSPDFDLGTPAPLNEGDTLVVNGTFTDPGADIWAATVAFDGGTSEPLPLDGFNFTVNRDYPQDGMFDVEVCISDGFSTTCRSTDITVLNVAPAFELGGPTTIDESESVAINESFTDPGADTWTATVAYDGGIPEALPLSGFDFNADRTYPEDGAYSIEVCVSDDDTTTCDTLIVDVLNVAPVVALDPAPDQLVLLVEDSISATFDDPGVLDTHTATIDWGDGTVDPLAVNPDTKATGAVAGGHAYLVAGQYTVEICVTDDEGDSGCASLLVDALSPADALADAIADLDSAAQSDSVVAAALKDLEGKNPQSASGALDKIEAGNYVAALTKLGKAVDALSSSGDDYADAQLILAQVAESVARQLLDQVEALGLTDATDLADIDAMRVHIDVGRTSLEASFYTDAMQSFKSAVQIGAELL